MVILIAVPFQYCSWAAHFYTEGWDFFYKNTFVNYWTAISFSFFCYFSSHLFSWQATNFNFFFQFCFLVFNCHIFLTILFCGHIHFVEWSCATSVYSSFISLSSQTSLSLLPLTFLSSFRIHLGEKKIVVWVLLWICSLLCTLIHFRSWDMALVMHVWLLL